VALETNPRSTANLADQQPVIENELPAYRAILPLAVVSLVLGVVSVFCFADYTFLVASALALVTGILADRKIQRLPDVWTGRGLAQAGVALGLVFGLSSVTIVTVQAFFRAREASKFGKVLAQTLQKESTSKVLWYRMPPEVRKTKDPEKALDDLKREARDPGIVEMQAGSILSFKARIASDRAERVELEEIERTGMDGLSPFAVARFHLQGPGSTKYPKDEYAAAVIKAEMKDGKYQWWIEEFVYPYTPRSKEVATKATDDGHGHGHAH
jgi:hypothetical protein